MDVANIEQALAEPLPIVVSPHNAFWNLFNLCLVPCGIGMVSRRLVCLIWSRMCEWCRTKWSRPWTANDDAHNLDVVASASFPETNTFNCAFLPLQPALYECSPALPTYSRCKRTEECHDHYCRKEVGQRSYRYQDIRCFSSSRHKHPA